MPPLEPVFVKTDFGLSASWTFSGIFPPSLLTVSYFNSHGVSVIVLANQLRKTNPPVASLGIASDTVKVIVPSVVHDNEPFIGLSNGTSPFSLIYVPAGTWYVNFVPASIASVNLRTACTPNSWSIFNPAVKSNGSFDK